MRLICVSLLCLSLFVISGLSTLSAAAIGVGDPAPSLGSVSSLNTATGKAVTIGQFKGRVILIDFWATWCGPCVAAMPHVQHLHETYGDKGLVVIGHTDTSSRDLENFLKKKGSTYICSIGTEIGGSWGVNGIPHVFVIDTKGVVVWSGHPAGLKDSVIEEALKSVSPQALKGGSPMFEKHATIKSIHKLELKIAAGKVGAGLKSLDKIIEKDKKPAEVAAAELSIAVVTEWLELSDAEIAAAIKKGDIFTAHTKTESIANALKGHGSSKEYKDRLKELKSDPAYKTGKEFQKYAHASGAAKSSSKFASSLKKFIKKHETGYYVDQAQAMLE